MGPWSTRGPPPPQPLLPESRQGEAGQGRVRTAKGREEAKEREKDNREREGGDGKDRRRDTDKERERGRGRGSDRGDRGNAGRDGSRDGEKDRRDDKEKERKKSRRDESEESDRESTGRSRSKDRSSPRHRRDKRKREETKEREASHKNETSRRHHSACSADSHASINKSRERSQERKSSKHRHSSRDRRAKKHRHHSGRRRRSLSGSESRESSSRSASPRRVVKNTSDPTRNSENDPFPADLQGPCFVKILPRARDPPVVLGIDNRGVLNLAKTHGCKLKLSAVADLYPQTERRFLLVYGAELGPCVAALQGWVAKTADASDSKRGAEITFLVPDSAMGAVRVATADRGKSRKKTALADLRKVCGARVKISSRRDMKKAHGRERWITLQGSVESVQGGVKVLASALQSFPDLRDYMNIQYVEYTQERRRRKRSPSPLPTIPRVVLREPSMPSATVPGLQFQRALQGVSVQDELVKITNLRGILDPTTPQMRGPAYAKIVISDLVTTLLLGTTTKEPNHSCPLRLIEATFKVAAKIMDPESPGILERVLVLSGEPPEVDKATLAVLEQVYAACIMAGQPSQVTWRMCASNSAASLIIGTGGHRVKQLRTLSNTRIQINTRDNVPNVDRFERVIAVTGSFDSVVSVTKAMMPFMHADTNHASHVHQCYGTGRKLEMPDWVENVVHRDGMNEEACRQPPLPDTREVTLEGTCFMKLLIDNGLANALIGENSANIQQLSEQTKCNMKFADPENVFPGCQGDRILMMAGSGDAMNAATIAVIEKCKEVHPNLSYDQMYGKVIIPQTCCSAIVGHGGLKIREIRDGTMTRVEISKKGIMTSERLVTIFGMPQGVHTALITVCGLIQFDPAVRALLEVVYPPEALEQQRKLEEERLSANVIGAVMEGVNAVISKVGGDEAAEAALRKLQEMQRAAVLAAGETAPETYDFRGPLGPMGQTRHDIAAGPDYSAGISFVPASGGGLKPSLPGQSLFPFPPPPPGVPPGILPADGPAVPLPPEPPVSSGLSRQELRQKILDASLNRAATAAEALRSVAPGYANALDDGDLEEDPSLAGLMDEKF
ncbi:putative KH domain-containing protein [Neospora caninum Liverpool]|uniref:KH domain-containing protein, putative n=1 Tax=Neospora caninum (strain Liverpool) TaxID=572307 RepID=F0VDY5_NEOCL|nr:putative KH domain-containing protein [Neospora caninum Liverpool]CBZ51928.1 putative KH domain-containing protein [Neospora caninum Liverpool]CEL65890.1 TPA: KH domain-containing protein, putative [Neospora caninum Liverpool]|eukprot:XP_003881961.1 putative KH domain-containing protein [Neospora caninum Liverpool]